ncbi:uncharacterized protein LOC106942306 isoform X2 [Poecilia latipinna]|uniref:uncharacterized protein LOC106942306 isoform X2 n=1 Tax=Poecilia latipinna TaxID=48699 RepID=UPI00072DB011|nr:PREDICTED: uncharacterized protein LOC106942306 isoform X2 [Poecilia latipinna]
MVTAQVFLRVSLFALLLVAVHGSPIKGSKSQSQGRPSDSSGDDDGSHQGSATGYSAPVFYSTYGGVSKPVGQYLGPPQYYRVGYTTGFGFVPVQAGSVAGYVTDASAPLPVGSFVPLQAGYAAIPPQAGTRANLPEMELVIAPQAFEEATTNTQPRGLSIVGPPLPPTPSTPTLQSGEMSNVVKEAEFGNYQQQMEAFGYPSDHVGPGLPPVALLASGVGGLLSFPSPYCLPYPFPYPYPDFDYRLLYGQYPPGTYTTFSKNHEKGKEYQTIHYLKEHGSDAPQNPAPQ